MATYKQRPPRYQQIEYDSEETEQEWVITSEKPIERRLVNHVSDNISDDDEWHVLSDTSPVEEGIPTFESNSEFASGGSDNDSEHYYIQDEATRSIESFIRKMPSHDGTGNFFNATPSNGSNHELSTSLKDSNLTSHYYDQDESLSHGLDFQNTSTSTRKNSRESWITKFRNAFNDVVYSQEQANQQIYHEFGKSVSSTANFELGNLENTNPIKVLANIGNESQKIYLEKLHSTSQASSSANAIDSSHTEKHASIITRLSIMPNDPMAINFTPTISKEMLNDMISKENVNSADHHQSQIPSQSLLSTFWASFCRITNNIIVSDDTDSVPNDPSNLTLASSYHNNHNTGLASIITGENHYDTCYLPFGNHLTLSELCPPLYSNKSHNYNSSSIPSTSLYNRRSSITSSNTTKILLTPDSSSTSLKSFASRAGSDCGLESGRGIGRSTTSEAPLVL